MAMRKLGYQRTKPNCNVDNEHNPAFKKHKQYVKYQEKNLEACLTAGLCRNALIISRSAS